MCNRSYAYQPPAHLLSIHSAGYQYLVSYFAGCMGKKPDSANTDRVQIFSESGGESVFFHASPKHFTIDLDNADGLKCRAVYEADTSKGARSYFTHTDDFTCSPFFTKALRIVADDIIGKMIN